MNNNKITSDWEDASLHYPEPINNSVAQFPLRQLQRRNAVPFQWTTWNNNLPSDLPAPLLGDSAMSLHTVHLLQASEDCVFIARRSCAGNASAYRLSWRSALQRIIN